MIDIEKATDAVADLLLALGAEETEHTDDTPLRVAKAWSEALSGYEEDPVNHLRAQFTGPRDPGLIIVAGIQVASTCAHHLLPIMGVATVAYRPAPGDKIVGLSKLSRLLNGYARRLQVQERLGHQVTAGIQQTLSPAGSACVITASHGCMSWRGVQGPTTLTTTQSLSGEWAAGHPDVRTVLSQHESAVRRSG